jgi:hypothetical protein
MKHMRVRVNKGAAYEGGMGRAGMTRTIKPFKPFRPSKHAAKQQKRPEALIRQMRGRS